MSGVPQPACTNCGKNFTFDDLRGTTCKYCGTVLAHHQRAAQQVAVINEMMADRNGNGIPDAYEGIVANAQRNAGAHVGAVMTGNPQASPYANMMAPPPGGGFGAYPPAHGMVAGPIAPYGNPQQQGANTAVAAAAASGVLVFVIVAVAVVLVFFGAGMFFFLAR